VRSKSITALLLCLLTICLCLPVIGYETPDGSRASLYHNDEAWYKDSMAPLLLKDEVYHIPTDILEMFPDISVQAYADNDNLLIHNTETGDYVSILFSTASAAVNGEIIENVDIFRQNGYHYVNAEWIAGICGLECMFQEDAYGNMLLRLTDGEQRRTFQELLASYTGDGQREESSTETEESVTPEKENIKRIYLVCTDTPGSTYTAADMIADNGLICTEFLREGSGEVKILKNSLYGTGGVYAGDCTVAAAERVNAAVERRLCRKLSMVLLPYAADTSALTEAGYVPVVPDFTVDYQTDPDRIYREMLVFLETNDNVILRIDTDGCSQRMLVLLCELLHTNSGYETAALTDWE